MTISVALCTYNGSRYIRQQIESILRQTMSVDEIVVCDDGSTDNTLTIIEEYQSTTTTNIRIYRNEQNMGFLRNFERAINLCHNGLVFLSDQDDIWMPHKVETIVRWFNDNPQMECVFTDAELINSDGKPMGKRLWDALPFFRSDRRRFDRGKAFAVLIRGNVATGATMALRKDGEMLFANICEQHNMKFHDSYLALHYAHQHTLGKITEQLIYYRIHAGQQTGISKKPIEYYGIDWDVPTNISINSSLYGKNNNKKIAAHRRLIDLRHRSKYKFWGWLIVFFHIHQYIYIYHWRWLGCILYDQKSSLVHSWERIKSKIHAGQVTNE